MGKNIEINYKEDSGYEVLYPQSISNIVYLSSTVEALFNYSSGALLDEALVQLYLGTGEYGYSIHVQCPDGSPVLGAVITGMDHPDGSSQIITNEEGNAIGVSLNTSVNLEIQSPYLDMQGASVQVNSEKALTEYTVILQPTGERTISTSVSAKTSPYLVSFDLCGVAGGGGGGGVKNETSPSSFGPGGGGGWVKNTMGVLAIPEKNIVIAIGAGGAAGKKAASAEQGSGKDGGNTEVIYDSSLILKAEGGKGGPWQDNNGKAQPGGVGNGNGGIGAIDANGGDGQDGEAIYKFNEESLGVPGGGGGGGGGGYIGNSSKGGSPNGAQGARSEAPATMAGLGGGGGGGFQTTVGRAASAGGNGVLYFRPTYKS